MELANLSKDEERVILNKGTEYPFTGEYDNFFKNGTYVCKRCGSPLYKSNAKFDAGCGWPAFDSEIEGSVKRIPDRDGFRTEIHKMGKLQHGVISDINPDIYNLYTIIQKNPGELIDSIGEIIYINDSVDYYDARSKFNAIKSEGIERATLFLYLNRHCYNGLYRVNAQGKFNVPFGKYSNPSIPSKEDILALSEVLQKCTILNLDFEIAVEGAREKDFVYFDPPYIPANKTSCFTDYNANGFSFEDQCRLSAVAKKLKDRDVYVMSSNSGFQKIKGLYPSFNINVTEGRRNINSKGEKRGKAEEIVITSYHHNVKYGNKL